MSLLALAYVLLDRPMQRRFDADPALQATLLLLQERVPRDGGIPSARREARRRCGCTDGIGDAGCASSRSRMTPSPEVQLLSNGRYHVMVTNAGGGYSRWRDLAVTRWREDGTRDCWGSFCYLRDVASGEFWSTAHQPTLDAADGYEAIFSEARAEFRAPRSRLRHAYRDRVLAEDDIELRRLRVTNRSRARAHDRSHELTPRWCWLRRQPTRCIRRSATCSCRPRLLPGQQAILCTRRPRSHENIRHGCST